MAKSYDEYEVDQLAKAKKQQQDYEQTARAQAGARAGEIQSLYDGLIADADRQYRQRAGDTAASYRGLYDANAVNELVARRNAQAAMADAGLRQSGLNASQQTAISLMRGNADAAVTRQKQDAVNSIMAALDELRSQYNAKAAAQKQDVYAALEDSVAKNWQTLDAQARQTAAALYQADVENERAAAEAQQKYKQWLYEQQLAATKQAQDYDVAMRKQGYTPVDDGEGSVYYRKTTTEDDINELIGQYKAMGASNDSIYNAMIEYGAAKGVDPSTVGNIRISAGIKAPTSSPTIVPVANSGRPYLNMRAEEDASRVNGGQYVLSAAQRAAINSRNATASQKKKERGLTI